MTPFRICTQGGSKHVTTLACPVTGSSRPRGPSAPRTLASWVAPAFRTREIPFNRDEHLVDGASRCAFADTVFSHVEGVRRPRVWRVRGHRVSQRVLAGLSESCLLLLTTVQTSPAIGDLGVALVIVSGCYELANLPGRCVWGPRHAGPFPASPLQGPPCPLRHDDVTFRPVANTMVASTGEEESRISL